MATQLCKTCKFFDEAVDENLPLGEGNCRRYPPSPRAMYATPQIGEDPPLVIYSSCEWLKWPDVDAEDYCGEWKERDEMK